MTIGEQRKALIEAAVLLAKNCNETSSCDACVFYDKIHHCEYCRLEGDCPEKWNLVGLKKEDT